MMERLPSQHVVLLGIGHTNAHVLRMWAMNPIKDASLTCISDYPVATYSGMLPAVLAGQHPREAMEIDLVRLCSSVGARLICDPVAGIDRQRREVCFADRPPVPYDALSIGIGSVPTVSGLDEGQDLVVKIKPMQSFLQRLEAAIAACDDNSDRPIRFLIVGGGVAGTEIAFCLSPFVEQVSGRKHSIGVVSRSERWLPEVVDSTRRRITDQMKRRGITITTGRRVTRVGQRVVDLDDGTSIEADVVIWATGAVAPDALDRFGLPLDDRGFLTTDATLRSTSGDPIFAVGDTGTIVQEPLPKAGVYAVRQGPILWENIQHLLQSRPLREYEPQRSFLKLINQGDGTAVGQWKGLSFSGDWVMRMKDRIDIRFMEKYRPRPMAEEADNPMQCRGCGCKLGGDVLESALEGYQAAVKLQDAAEIGRDAEQTLVASTDFFSSPIDDAFLAGRVAALHSASDIVASGAIATHALANVVIPEGDRKTQQRMLQDFLAGARLEFDAMGASIVGGHTIVGPRMEVGFTVIGKTPHDALMRKENLKPGDVLFLTKPLGIGILLAAHARSLCKAADYENLIAAMVQRQHAFAGIAAACDITAGTDVTGFGLAGHLLEMCDASDVGATIDVTAIPLLDGVEECLAEGVESSLTPDNRRVQSRFKVEASRRAHPSFQAMFDPQTCGGLLLGVSSGQVSRMETAFAEIGAECLARIGSVTPRPDDAKVVVR